MSVQSFGNMILNPKVKSLTAQHDLQISSITDYNAPFGRAYTHSMNSPNDVTNPNNYQLNIYEKIGGAQNSHDLIAVSASNSTGSGPFNTTNLTIDSNNTLVRGTTTLALTSPNITLNGVVNIGAFALAGISDPLVGSVAPYTVVVPITGMTANAVVLLTQTTGGTAVDNYIYTAAAGQFTIESTTASGGRFAYFVAKL